MVTIDTIYMSSATEKCGRSISVRVKPPPPLRTTYRPILALRTAYCHLLASRTVYSLTTKNNHFGRFYLRKEDKITFCCMHMYNHS